MTDDARWQRTTDAVRAALTSGDVNGLAPLLAPDVRWHGAGPGGCHSPADVLAWAGTVAQQGLRLVELHRVGPRVLVHVAVGPSEETLVLTLDAEGRIALMLGYTDPVTARRDLAAPAVAEPTGLVVGLIPFVGVRDVAASVAFYGVLGFAVTREHRADGRLGWVMLRAGDAYLMLAEDEDAVDAARQGVLFYLYSDDLAGLREHLRARGATPSEIVDGSPGPRAEMRVDDPDGYCLMIAQREG